MFGSPDSGKYSEQTLQEAEHFIQAALDSLSAHVALLDENGTIISVNAAWRAYAAANGYTDDDDGIGVNYLAVCDDSVTLNAADAARAGEGIRAVMNGSIPLFELEYPCHSPMEKRWFIMRVTRFDWYDSPRYIVAHQNVTTQKRIQFALEENQQRLQAIFDTVGSGIVTLDRHYRVESANPVAASMFGCDAPAMHGQPFDTFLDDASTLDSLETASEYELTGRRADGSTFPLVFAMNKTRLSEGHIFTVIVQDITERKRLEAEVMEKERLAGALEKERELREFKSRFMSMMTHELRTPLTSIRLSHDMLTLYSDQTPEEEKAQYLANIRSQVEYLAELIQDISTISKVQNQQLDFTPEKRDLLTFCRSVVEEYQLAYHKTHPIHFNTDCGQLVAMIDGTLMRQILNNLLANAIKYTPDGGQVMFDLLCDGQQQAIIRVSDEGIGIPQEDLESLFEPFYRASNVGKLPGSGLGLAIAKQAIDLHGGSIAVASALGSGTTFTIHLPILNSRPLVAEDDDWA